MKKGARVSIGSKIRDLGSVECGAGAPVRIIANIGTTLREDSVEEEILKAKAAYKAGADMITDHSMSGNIKAIHQRLLESVPCPVSTVSVYQAYVEAQSERAGLFNPKTAVRLFKQQASLGLDLINVHATILKEDLSQLAFSQRLIPCTSRGGMMVADLMLRNDIENPYWTHFEDIADICKDCGVTLRLVTAFRPGSIMDVPDEFYKRELMRMSKLVEISIERDVGIMIEGIGHARLDIIPDLVREAKTICHGAPYCVLSVACDSAIYRDHIASAIASAVAVASGADVIGAVSRSEHVGRPSTEDVIEAVETAKIAAHCGEIVRRNDSHLDDRISMARSQTSCLARGVQAILPRKEEPPDYVCTMCGPYCALKIMRRITNQALKEEL